MFCKSCGKLIDDDSKYCIHCGTKIFSDKESAEEMNKKSYGTPYTSKTSSEDLPEKFGNPIPYKHALTSINSQLNVLEEFALTTKQNTSLRRIIGIVLSFIGCFLLAWDTAFIVLSDQPITQIYSVTFGTIYGSRGPLTLSLIILFIACFILSKDRLILNKIISIAIDGLALYSCLYLAEYLFIGKNSDNDFIAFFLYQNVFTNKIIAWSLFLSIYYFVAELYGGTIGKRIAGLISQTQQKQRISFKQSCKKTVVYAIPIWITLICCLWNPHILNNLSDSIIVHFCQWTTFLLLFTSLFMIFISKQNHSLADLFSQTVVDKQNNKTSFSDPIGEQVIKRNLEVIANADANISGLHNLIAKEKKKIFPGQNKLILDKIEELCKDKESFYAINKIYKDQYSKEIPEHLRSISSGYGSIYYYLEPLIKLGVCEDEYPHRIISVEL